MFQTTMEETYRDGEIIFEEGSFGDWIYEIISGQVEISKVIAGKKIVIEVLKPGDVFGELGFITQHPRTATARAIGNTVLGVLDRTFLDNEFNRLSFGFQTIVKSIATRLVKTTEIASQAQARRQDERKPKVLAISYKSKDAFKKAFTENISSGGMFIKTRTPMVKDELCVIQIQLPEETKPICIDATVAWARSENQKTPLEPAGMGVRFVRVSAEDRHRLQRILQAPVAL